MLKKEKGILRTLTSNYLISSDLNQFTLGLEEKKPVKKNDVMLGTKKLCRDLDLEKEVFIKVANEIIFVKYVVPDLIRFLLEFSKDMDFEDLLAIV